MNDISTLLKTNPASADLVFWKQNFITFEIAILFMLWSVNDGKLLDIGYILIKSA